MFVLNNLAGDELHAVLASAPLFVSELHCATEVSLVEIGGNEIYIYNMHDNVAVTLTCESEASARSFAREAGLL